ncbi:MAG: hypothetical protein J7M32_08130 [Deltaproteobacteria bacterium]|nr:hypothetical protein [Deltaproteobacteria bacterium]
MKPRKMAWLRWSTLGVVFCLGLLAGARDMALAAPEEFACVEQDKISKDIAPEAQLEGLTCFFKKYKGANALHFKLTVKNISTKPQRYRVHIFLDNGKAVGGLIPKKTKAGLVQPGQSATFVYPVTRMAEKPGCIDLKIATMNQ